jgi:hypothetical protein
VSDPEREKTDLQSRLGYKQLSRTWAKIEIMLGLTAAGVGIFVGVWGMNRQGIEENWTYVVTSLILFVLGGYLAMAGNRSHLYQTSNEQIGYLAEKIDRLQKKD